MAPAFAVAGAGAVKQKQYKIFIEVCKLIKTKGYKNDEDLKTIVDLAWDMNNSGIQRRISKEEYLATGEATRTSVPAKLVWSGGSPGHLLKINLKST